MSLPPRRDFPTPKHPLKHLPLRSLVAPTSAGTPWRLHGICDLLVRTTVLWELRRSLPVSRFDSLYLPTAMPLSSSPLGILHPTVRPHELVQGNGFLLLVNPVSPRPTTPLDSFSPWTFPEPARRRRPGCMIYGTYPGPQDGVVLGRPPDRARRGLIVDGRLSVLRKPANRAPFPLSYVPLLGQLAGTDP